MTLHSEDMSRDPTAATVCHLPDNRFVPVRLRDLVEAIAVDESRFGVAAASVHQLADALEDVIDQEAAAFERFLADAYCRFNPDRDTVPVDELATAQTSISEEDLACQLDYLFGKANFERLSDVQIEQAILVANTHGLKVRLNPERIESLTIYVRGRGELERRRPTWRHPLRGELRHYEVFHRLVVVCRLKNDPHLILKLFKEIPVVDIEALLPHAEIEMNWFDRLKVMGGGVGAIGSTAAKIANVIAITKLIWILAMGAGVLAFRTFTGYRTARLHRDSLRTRHLYYQNLDNNAGVIHYVVSLVGQEEAKEAILTYCTCAAAETAPNSIQGLGDRIEAFLEDRFGAEVEFDVTDAVQTLHRLRLWEDARGLRVVPPAEAILRLREHWSRRRTRRFHEEMARAAAHS